MGSTPYMQIISERFHLQKRTDSVHLFQPVLFQTAVLRQDNPLRPHHRNIHPPSDLRDMPLHRYHAPLYHSHQTERLTMLPLNPEYRSAYRSWWLILYSLSVCHAPFHSDSTKYRPLYQMWQQTVRIRFHPSKLDINRSYLYFSSYRQENHLSAPLFQAR